MSGILRHFQRELSNLPPIGHLAALATLTIETLLQGVKPVES